MNKSLVHHFNVEEATELKSVEKAVILSNLRFWLEKNLANKKNGHKHADGHHYVWTYNSSEAFSELFPYMAPSSIRRYLKQLEDDGFIISGNFNKFKWDRTKWYSISDYCIDHIDQWVAQIEQSVDQSDQPIPDVTSDDETTDEKQNAGVCASADKVDKAAAKPTVEKKPTPLPPPSKTCEDSTITDFKRFYQAYPKHQGKADALKAFKQMHKKGSLPPVSTLLSHIAARVDHGDWKGINKAYIPLPASFLRGERWDDDIASDSGQSSVNLESTL